MWKIIGTSVQGRSHIQKNIPVQDKIFHVKGDVTVIALADGAGSAKLSHFGAQCVVETMFQTVVERFDSFYEQENITVVQQEVIEALLAQLKQLAAVHAQPIQEFASTLLCVAVKGEKGLIFHLGDGEIGAVKDGELLEVSTGSNGEYANATFFVTSPGAARYLQLFKSANILKYSSLFLMSDGAAESLHSKQQRTFSNVLTTIFEKSEYLPETKMNDLLEESFENFVKMKTNDDCAFIGMTFVSEPSEKYLQLSASQQQQLMHPFLEEKHFSVKKAERILNELQQPLTKTQLQKKLRVKKKYFQTSLRALEELHFVERKRGKYKLLK